MLGTGRHTNQQSWLGRTRPSATQLDNFPAQANLSLYSTHPSLRLGLVSGVSLGKQVIDGTQTEKAFRKYHFSLFFTLHSIKGKLEVSHGGYG